ncbi:AP2/ERF and B3 domain-containing transcription factor RAV1 [Bienertia sinuspersici]
MDYHYSDLSSQTISSTTSSSSTLSYSISLTPKKKQRSSSSCKYKGVVPQPNGRWGAQLYNGNKRVWIGTYDTQHQAAHAYDMAVIRFRGAQAMTNFPIRHYDKHHVEFLATHTQARVIDMLRNHTYEDELARFMRSRLAQNQTKGSGQAGLESGSTIRELLFKKVMTHSDVGRLHRLVIPKHQAESYLPKIAHTRDYKNVGGEVMLSFEDGKKDRMWRFKYCYWKSSQNYVLTKGWGEFVKDKGLKPGDTVSFYTNLVESDKSKRFSIDHISCKEVVAKEVSDDSVATGSTTSSRNGNNNSNSDDDNGNAEVAFSSSNLVIRLFGYDICPLIPPVVNL